MNEYDSGPSCGGCIAWTLGWLCVILVTIWLINRVSEVVHLW